jgi:iron(III) transport system substrate-binding protein
LARIALLWAGCWGLAGCRPAGEQVVVYAAQDRVFAEPVFREFEAATGLAVRAVYDNEATKTTGLANRLIAESRRPQADLWWSNEEMRTRQLARLGVIEPNWITFGRRQRVLVVNTNSITAMGSAGSFGMLTNEALRGRWAMAYPVFGTTAAHFLILRQRWGDDAWQARCRALAANRPLLVDGNSMVVRLVGRGDVRVGLTDSDDVVARRREGWPVAAVPLAGSEGLNIPNTIAVVTGAPRPEAARRLAEYLSSPAVRSAMVSAGALDPETGGAAGGEGAGSAAADWEVLLEQLEPGLRWLEQVFVR